MSKFFVILPVLILSACANFNNKSTPVVEQPTAQTGTRKMSSVNGDSFATISCPYTIYSGDEHGNVGQYQADGIEVKNKEGKWVLRYTDCTDGDVKYTVQMGQNKFFNLDFLLDKGMADRRGDSTGTLHLTCIGTDVKGVYKAGAFMGLGLGGSARIGVFASAMGAQSVCVATDFKLAAIGVELSPYSLEIK